uniref:oligosaccharide flippase family protein n=1 Tax=Lachnoclostridium phocaeense TaxID=1871021 RepID=UPI0026DCCED3|nr:oligosaccharide flippase family protein [Lachnoclostridium phocaeense]
MLNKLLNKYNRDKKMYNNILGTALIKAFSLILNIYSINAYLHFFCGNRLVYGVWLTTISILNWIVNFDLGIGNGLRNRLVEAITLNDTKKQKTYISSAYILIGIVSIIILVILCIVFKFIDWNYILNIDESIIDRNTLFVSIIITLIGLSAHFVLKLIVSVLYALKETAMGSVVTLLINLLIIVYSSIFSVEEPSVAIVYIAIAYTVTMIAPLIIVTIVVFNTRLKGISPSFKYYNHKIAKSILSLGGQFFAVQLLLLVINSTNEFIITRIDGPESVVIYNIYFRLFSAVIALFSVIINPVWSAITECFSKKDYTGIIWRKRTINIIGTVFSVLCFVLAFSLQLFVDIFYKSSHLIVEYKISIAFAVFSSLLIFVNATSCVENGINDLRPQIVGNAFAATLKIPLIIAFCTVSRSWEVVVYCNVIIMAISLLIQYAALQRKLKQLRKDTNWFI